MATPKPRPARGAVDARSASSSPKSTTPSARRPRGATAKSRASAAARGASIDRSRPAATKPESRGANAGSVATRPDRKGSQPVLLSGGNPQIAKADGDAPVQAYLAAIPGWKRDVGRLLDALIERAVPGVRKAVKWNSPFYGVEGHGWFLSFHCFTKYIKVGFFRGSSLRPLPPGESKTADARYLDLYENAPIDEKQLRSWIQQAAAIPGWGGAAAP